MPTNDAIQFAVTAMVDAVNRVDMAGARNWFADAAVIIEDIPPYRWEGPDAVGNWLAAMARSAANLQADSIVMELAVPLRIEVESGRAYAVFPGTLRLATAGGTYAGEGLLTFTLKSDQDRWLIDTLTWCGPNPRLN